MDDILRIIPDLSQAEIERGRCRRVPVRPSFTPDLARVTDGLIDDGMAATLVREAAPTIQWLHDQGVKFTLMTGRQANEVDGKLVFLRRTNGRGGRCRQGPSPIRNSRPPSEPVSISVTAARSSTCSATNAGSPASNSGPTMPSSRWKPML